MYCTSWTVCIPFTLPRACDLLLPVNVQQCAYKTECLLPLHWKYIAVNAFGDIDRLVVYMFLLVKMLHCSIAWIFYIRLTVTRARDWIARTVNVEKGDSEKAYLFISEIPKPKNHPGLSFLSSAIYIVAKSSCITFTCNNSNWRRIQSWSQCK